MFSIFGRSGQESRTKTTEFEGMEKFSSIPLYTAPSGIKDIKIPEPNEEEQKTLTQLREAIPELTKDLPPEPKDDKPHSRP